MDLHGQMMNLPCDASNLPLGFEGAFKQGHKQARHAAAELALGADAEIARFREALIEIRDSDAAEDWCRETARDALKTPNANVTGLAPAQEVEK
jgi:hypothetical protein